MNLMDRNFTITTWKEGEYYIAQCLDVDISSFGKTYKEAIKNIREALELYLEDVDIDEIPKVETPAISMTKIKQNA